MRDRAWAVTLSGAALALAGGCNLPRGAAGTWVVAWLLAVVAALVADRARGLR